MRKYYVSTQNRNWTGFAFDWKDAAKRAVKFWLKNDTPNRLGEICCISETGFYMDNPDDRIAFVSMVLDELGVPYERE